MNLEDYVRMAIFHKRKRQRIKAWKRAGELSKNSCGEIQYYQLLQLIIKIKKDYRDKPKTLKYV